MTTYTKENRYKAHQQARLVDSLTERPVSVPLRVWLVLAASVLLCVAWLWLCAYTNAFL